MKRLRTEGTAKPKRAMTASECDAGYRLLTKDRHPELERQRQFNDALKDAQQEQRMRLTGLKPAEGKTLDEKMQNAEREQQKRLNNGVAL